MVSGVDTPLSAPRAGTFFSRGQSFLSSDEDSNALCLPDASARRRAPPRSIKGARGIYLLGETLGSGVTSVVRAGIHTDTLLVVAIKVLDLHRLRRHPGGIERVNTEIRILRELGKKPHPNVITLKDLVRDEAKRRIYLVMEMVNGAPMQNLIQEEGQGDVRQGRRLPHTQVANIIAQVLSALEYVHGRGFVHRDVKPANLLLTSTGLIKLSDFGVSESLDRYDAGDSVTRTSGTPAFQAPEIADGQAAYSGTKLDVWAVGVTAFYMLCGELPFHALTHVQLYNTIAEGKYAFPTDLQKTLPADAVDAIEKMLRVNFKDRWSVDQLLRHPWIVSGSKPISKEQQVQLGWSLVPAKTFGVLDLASRYMEADVQAARTETPDIALPHADASTPSGSNPSVGRVTIAASRFSPAPGTPASDTRASSFGNGLFDPPPPSTSSSSDRRSSFAAGFFDPPPSSSATTDGRSATFASGLFDPPPPNPAPSATFQRPENPLLTPSSSDSDSSDFTAEQYPGAGSSTLNDLYSRGTLELMDVPVARRTAPRRVRAGGSGFPTGSPWREGHAAQTAQHPGQLLPDTAAQAEDTESGSITAPVRHNVSGSGFDSESGGGSDAELAAALSGAEVTRWPAVGMPDFVQQQPPVAASDAATAPVSPDGPESSMRGDAAVQPITTGERKGDELAQPGFGGVVDSGTAERVFEAPDTAILSRAADWEPGSGEDSDAELAAALAGAHVTRWSDIPDVAPRTAHPDDGGAMQRAGAAEMAHPAGAAAGEGDCSPGSTALRRYGCEEAKGIARGNAALQRYGCEEAKGIAAGGAFAGGAHIDSDWDSDAELFAALDGADVVRWPGTHEHRAEQLPMAPLAPLAPHAAPAPAREDSPVTPMAAPAQGDAQEKDVEAGEKDAMCVIV